MHTSTTALLASTLLSFTLLPIRPLVGAQDIEATDIPPQCTPVCSSLVTASTDCERFANSDDSDNPTYVNCMCTGQNAEDVIRMCEACVFASRSASDPNDDDNRDNDVNDILTECGFSTTTYDLSASSTPSPMTANTESRVTGSTTLTGTRTTATPSASSGNVASSVSASISSAISPVASVASTPNAGFKVQATGAALAGAAAVVAAAWA